MRYNAKKTLGVAGPVFVSNAAASPGETTFAAFVASADDGEIAIFNEAGAKVTAALTVGNKYFIAQKQGTDVKRTPLFTYKSSNHKDYNAGTKHSASITVPASIAKNDILHLSVIETTPFLEPLPTWDYSVAAKNTTVLDAVVELIAQINNENGVHNDYNGRMVLAQLISSQGTYAEFENDPTFTKGSKVVKFAGDPTIPTTTLPNVGDFVYVKGEVYRIEAVDDTADTITLSHPFSGETTTIDVSAASGADSAGVIAAGSIGTLTIKLEALEYDVHFRAAGSQESDGVEEALTIAHTSFVRSSGRPENVADVELEGMVWEGYRTNNTAHGEDFGKPNVYASSSNTYQMFTIKFENEQKSVAAPIEKDQHTGYVIVFLLNSSTQWDTQFGL